MRVVLVTAPAEAADSLASTLVEERLAACVSALPNVASTYRWEGAVERGSETLLVVKTHDRTVPALVRRVAEIHPYACPEIVALAVETAHAPYAAWVDRESMPKVSRSGDDVGCERGASPRTLSRLRQEGAMKKKAPKKAAKKSTAKKTKKRK